MLAHVLALAAAAPLATAGDQTAAQGTVTIGDANANAGDEMSGRPHVTAARTNTPPVIDGNLDDPVWTGAARIDRFTQQRPVEGAPATEQTEIFIA